MKDGVLLRQVINVIDTIKSESVKEKNLLSEVYETILKSLQSAGNSRFSSTPRRSQREN